MYTLLPLFHLAIEANEVVGLRVMKIASGVPGALDEIHLMFIEKVNAAAEAGISMFFGRSPVEVAERYREHVANNQRRLSA